MSDQTFPMPGDRLSGSTVVASTHYDDDHAVIVLLNERKPFYTVALVKLGGFGGYPVVTSDDHPNIVPAVEAYRQSGGDY